jgi:hypothetical protein
MGPCDPPERLDLGGMFEADEAPPEGGGDGGPDTEKPDGGGGGGDGGGGPPGTCRAPVMGRIDFDVPVINVAGMFTQGGLVPVDSYPGFFYLYDPATGGYASLGTYRTPPVASPIIQGTYDLYYRRSQSDIPSATYPVNTNALLRGGIKLGASQTLSHDLSVVTLRGVLKVDGVVPPKKNATVWLRNAAGDTARLGVLGDPSYQVAVLPGTYDVYYMGAYGAAPANPAALLQKGLKIDAARTLDVDVPTVTVSGRVTQDGLTTTDANAGTVYLYDRAAEQSVSLGSARSASYSVQIVPGTYDLYYRRPADLPATISPANTNALLRAGVKLETAQTLDVNVSGVTLRGVLKVDGAVPPKKNATVWLRNAAGDSARLGYVGDPSYQAVVLPGTYDIYYAAPTGAEPQNPNVLVRQGVKVEGSGLLDVEVPTVTVSGKVTLGGLTVATGSAPVWLVDPGTGSAVRLSSARDASYSVRVVPGTYDLYYGFRAMTPSFAVSNLYPVNNWAKIRAGVKLETSQALDVDIRGVVLRGQAGLSGEPVMNKYGSIWLRSAAGDMAPLASTALASYNTMVLSGRYDVYYNRNGGSGQTGAVNNSTLWLGCVDVP